MQRIARPLLMSVLVWLLVLSTGAIPGRPLGSSHRSGPGGPPSGHRPYLPAKRGATPPSQDEPVKVSHLLKLAARTTAVPARIPSCPAPRQDGCLSPPGLPRNPLYLILCTLLR